MVNGSMVNGSKGRAIKGGAIMTFALNAKTVELFLKNLNTDAHQLN
jgi:hypothetical protein